MAHVPLPPCTPPPQPSPIEGEGILWSLLTKFVPNTIGEDTGEGHTGWQIALVLTCQFDPPGDPVTQQALKRLSLP